MDEELGRERCQRSHESEGTFPDYKLGLQEHARVYQCSWKDNDPLKKHIHL